MKYDCHVHLFDAETPLRAARRYAPDASATQAQLEAAMTEHGVEAALLVQTSFAASPAQLFRVATAHPDRYRVVVSPADLAELEAEWDRWLQAGAVGVRLNLVGRGLPDLTEPGWHRMAERMAAAGVHLELHAEGDEWAGLTPGVERWPGAVVIDHVGRPTDAAAMIALGVRENVWLKVSAPYRWPDPTVADAVVARLLDETGGVRLLWGSDWPHTQHGSQVDYAAMVEFAQVHWPETLRGAFDANLEQLLGDRRF